ncbi:MAG: DUF1194 domain-containing protein [Pseudomonadota bacterium]
MRVLCAVASLCNPGWAEAACRLALVLALDVSGSVDQREYRLQLDGIAAALDTPEVRGAILALPDAHVELAVFEWSAARYSRDILDWTALTSEASIDAIAARLRTLRRVSSPEATGLGAAMERAGRMLQDRADCWKRVADISGDGKNNDWPLPLDVKADGMLDAATVNALVVGIGTPRIGDERQAEITELSSYFRTEVLHGPDAFLEVALGYEDYARAMTRKLLREISAPPLGALPIRPLHSGGRRAVVSAPVVATPSVSAALLGRSKQGGLAEAESLSHEMRGTAWRLGKDRSIR